jgi:hypothetical protein
VDIWRPDPVVDSAAEELVICNGTNFGSKLILSQALEIINELAFERTRLQTILGFLFSRI